jgi:hypothetical protein
MSASSVDSTSHVPEDLRAAYDAAERHARGAAEAIGTISLPLPHPELAENVAVGGSSERPASD